MLVELHNGRRDNNLSKHCIFIIIKKDVPRPSFSMLKLKDFDFKLPKSLIAQQPASPRDSCNLMVVKRSNKTIYDDKFFNIDKYLNPGDVLVLNDSKVLPARLIGKKESGGKVEILLLKQINSSRWECLVGLVPIKKQVGLNIYFSSSLKGEIIEREGDVAVVEFSKKSKELMDEIFKLGVPPTPPYIKRLAKSEEYQTVYAKKLGSVAAPTAGMHFTDSLLRKIRKKGVKIEYITLHVGLGTFQGVKEENILNHKMHSEFYELSKGAVKTLNEAKEEGKRVIACGTTSVRVLESCVDKKGKLYTNSGETDIFIYPGYKFKYVDCLLTNFHVPKSTLIMLVCAFADKKIIRKAYKEAIEKEYRFYSFGDSMLIL